MGKLMYQIIIKENYVNDYILGRISGILDWCAYTGDNVKSTDVLHVNGEWIFNCKMYYETYLKIRNYITACYPNIKFEYFKIMDNQMVEA
jgi:hypothetical protein